MNYPIQIDKTPHSRLAETDLENIIFGRIFSDHMLMADYEDSEWKNVQILPYQNISLSPATTALHYGQAVFEGMKAYKNNEGEVLIFRPEDNWDRLNRSAHRLCMPSIPKEIFIDGLKQLLKLDKDWIPTKTGSSLYIRPFMFATDEFVGIKSSDNYKFIIFSSPVNSYYPEPIKVKIETKYVRACRGGIGMAKAAGNYAASLYPASLGQKQGYRQLIWTDALEHKYIEESGTMNLFFKINGKVITPPVDKEDGTILEGITRESAIRLMEQKGVTVESRRISVDEVVEAARNGQLEEMFGTGTAATIAHISAIGFQDEEIALPPIEERELSNWLLDTLEGIKRGETEDTFGWVVKV